MTAFLLEAASGGGLVALLIIAVVAIIILISCIKIVPQATAQGEDHAVVVHEVGPVAVDLGILGVCVLREAKECGDEAAEE